MLQFVLQKDLKLLLCLAKLSFIHSVTYLQPRYCILYTLPLKNVWTFVQSIWKANLPMFINSLEKVIPWMFALDNTNYSRWLPVYLKSIMELHLIPPTVFEGFLKGFFTVDKINRFHAYQMIMCMNKITSLSNQTKV